MKRSDSNYLLHREQILQDLLEAAKEALNYIEHTPSYITGFQSVIEGVLKLKQAISKAEGRDEE